MTDRPAVVGVVGSRRDGSHTRTAVVRVLDACADAGAETTLLDLGDVDLPLYHPDEGDRGDAAALRATVRDADGVLLASPVYHGTYSSTLKNFHDYCGSEEYADTAVGLLAVAGGSTYGPTLEHLRATVRNVHGHCIPEQVGVPNASGQFDADGAFTDDALAERVATFAESLLAHARLHRGTGGADAARVDADD